MCDNVTKYSTIQPHINITRQYRSCPHPYSTCRGCGGHASPLDHVAELPLLDHGPDHPQTLDMTPAPRPCT